MRSQGPSFVSKLLGPEGLGDKRLLYNHQPGSEGDIIRAIRDTWTALLPSSPFEFERSWSEAGLDSLKSLEFVLLLERALDARIGFDAMAPECTPSDLVRLLTSSGTPGAIERRPRLFLIPAIYGDEPRLARFRLALRRQILFEILELPDIDCSVRLLGDISATAAKFLENVIRLQPEGDIMLAGYSYGAIVAQELAHQLEVKGRKVTFLALLDGLLSSPAPLALATRTATGGTGSKASATLTPALNRKWAAITRALGLEKNWFRSTIDNWKDWGTFIDQSVFSILLRINAWEAARRFIISAARRRDWVWTNKRRTMLLMGLRGSAVLRWRPNVSNTPTLLVTSDDLEARASVKEWQVACPHHHLVSVHCTHDRLFEPAPLATISQAILESMATVHLDARAPA